MKIPSVRQCSFLVLKVAMREKHTIGRHHYMDNGIDYTWIGEMFICIIHGAVHYSWIAKMQNNNMHGQGKMYLYYPWVLQNESVLSNLK